ncbi:hypothetical protein KKH15_01385, partial [Patescibacteria group bacterium]|nr:hypothetical protein [Patescibacteria group bacterium]MBU1755046.1 hypothetical protein [Patescibacteria group bacterium]
NQADRRQMRQESIGMASMAGMILVVAVAIIATIYEVQVTNFLVEVVGRIMPGLVLPGLTPI